MGHKITDEEKLMLQSITLTEGENAWEYVRSKPLEDQHWAMAGILSCGSLRDRRMGIVFYFR